MEVKLKAHLREIGAKSALSGLRDSGKIPGVYYGRKIDPVNIYVDEHELRKALSTEAGLNVLINLSLESPDGAEPSALKGKQVALVKDMQRNPIKGDILHVDFVKVSLTEEIQASVPLIIIGEAPGVKLGGVLQHPIREVAIKCLPTNLPESIEIDVGEMEIGDSVNVGHLSAPEGVEILDDPEEILVSVVPPTKVEEVVPVEEEEAEEAAEGEEELEPEVIGEKKKEEEPAEE